MIVLLPAHNEEEAIESVINEIRSVGNYDIVVAASGCTDNTAKIAKNSGCNIIDAPIGKGEAIRYALHYLDSSKGIVMMDSDGTYPAEYIPLMANRLKDGYQVIMGSRRFPETGSFPPLNRLGNGFITGLANFLYRTKISDLCTGMWAFKPRVAQSLNLSGAGFCLEADIFINCVRQGYRITEVPITYRCRTGKRKINRLDHLRIMQFLIKRRLNW